MKIIRFFLIFILILGIGFFLKSDFWKIKIIDCQQNGGIPCRSDFLTQLVNLTFGKNIILLKKKKIVKEFLNSNPILKDLKIKKRIPNKLTIEIEERKEAVVLTVELSLTKTNESTISGKPVFETEGDFYVVDEEGFLLSKEKNLNLPLILISEPIQLNIGEKIKEEKIIKAIEFLTSLRLNLFSPKIAKIATPYSLEVWLEKNILAIFSFKKEKEIQIDSLQFILNRAKIEGRGIKKIDLRFDKPVIIYE